MVHANKLVDALEALGNDNFNRIDALLARGKFVSWKKEQAINLPSTRSGNMVFVVNGVLAVSSVGSDGAHGAGMSVFPGGFLNVGPDTDHSAAQVIIAVTHVSAVIVSNQLLKKWMTDNLTAATSMLNYFHEQSMTFADSLKVVGAHSVQERAIGFIEQFIHHHEPDLTDKQGRSYRWDISQQGFATLIGTNRSHLSVVLGKLRKGGEVIINGRTLLIPKRSSIGR